MAYSDQIVKRYLAELKPDQPVTCQLIADRTGISHRTVKRAVRRLIENGEIRRYGSGRRWGYVYEHSEQ